jgi:hypothetical protein
MNGWMVLLGTIVIGGSGTMLVCGVLIVLGGLNLI